MSVNPSQSRKLLPLPVFNTALFLSVRRFSPQSPLSPQRQPPPRAAICTALLFGHRHLLASSYGSVSQSDTLPCRLPQEFMLRIFQLSGVRCRLPAKSHVTSSPGNKVNAPSAEPLPVRCPTNFHGEPIPWGFATGLGPGRSSKILHVSVSSL